MYSLNTSAFAPYLDMGSEYGGRWQETMIWRRLDALTSSTWLDPYCLVIAKGACVD